MLSFPSLQVNGKGAVTLSVTREQAMARELRHYIAALNHWATEADSGDGSGRYDAIARHLMEAYGALWLIAEEAEMDQV